MKNLKKMNVLKVFSVVYLLFAVATTNAQVGIGTNNPATSAQLDVSSTTKGFLPPRMTQAERNTIVSPVPGLTIWCKDCGTLGELQVYNGVAWTNTTGGYPTLAIPPTVAIGDQNWMSKNLDVVTYRNGDTIPEVTDPVRWANLKDTGAWCYYDNDAAKGSIYGKLYNRAAIMDGRGLAPEGWKVPGNRDWKYLVDSLGGSTSGGISSVNFRATIYLPEANQMRATPILWQSPNSGTTNESGFTALPAGNRNADGSYSSLGSSGKWWSTGDAEDWGPLISHRLFHVYFELNLNSFFNASIIYFYRSPALDSYYDTPEGFSVRCIKD